MSYTKRKIIDLSIEPFNIKSMDSFYGGGHIIPNPNGVLYSLYECSELEIKDGERISVLSPIYLRNSIKGFTKWFFIPVNGDKESDTLEKMQRAYDQIEEITDPYPSVQGPFKNSAEAEQGAKYLVEKEFHKECPISVKVNIYKKNGEFFCSCTYRRV